MIDSIKILREKYLGLADDKYILEVKIKELELEIYQYEVLNKKRKIKGVNKKSNQPSSKQPEWEQKGVGNDGINKGKGRGKKARKGAVNCLKNKSVTRFIKEAVECCSFCGEELNTIPLSSKNIRIIEDIPVFPIAIEVTSIELDKKYCSCCKKVTTATTDLALPGSDYGINTTVAILYHWVYSCLSLPRISGLLTDFFSQKISTAGISKQVIRVAGIMKPIYKRYYRMLN